MDQDQFGGRTDDDLFADDIELVPYEEQHVAPEAAVPIAEPQHSTAAAVEPAAQQETPEPPAPISDTPTTAQPPPKSLAQSRHYRPDNRPEKTTRSATNNGSSNTKPLKTNADVPSSTTPEESSNNGPPPTAPKGPAAGNTQNKNTASAVSEARLGSGANPRTKLTDAELTARMEEMRIVNAAKTRRFEQAQRDEAEHAVAYAKGMQDARKRRAEETAKRKVAEEEKKRLEDERAKNRDRKLKAIGLKDGGWDEGKEERLREEQERAFKGAHGGVRGVKSYGGGGAGGLSGSRFASTGDDDYDGHGMRGRFGQSSQRGRGGRRGGRGGNGQLFHTGDDGRPGNKYQPIHATHVAAQSSSGPPAPGSSKAELNPQDFPELPSSTAAPKPSPTWVSTSTAGSSGARVADWADEVNDHGN
ncbi:hypothetical protein QBC44DRAFT_300359 [Cladorrhinum sp. PSN332]|nr:hypothetical protein QBC44DRAFT_300359 [Cladorrhinum sp. PSN332]